MKCWHWLAASQGGAAHGKEIQKSAHLVLAALVKKKSQIQLLTGDV